MEDRPQSLTECPLVIAGGGALLSAEPLTPFVDIMVLGDGEESLPDVLRMLEKALEQGWTRSEMLLQSRTIPGVYVPSLFKQEFDADGAPVFPQPLLEDYQYPTRRIAADLNNAALSHTAGGTRGCCAQQAFARDCPWLHARLPFLPCGHGIPPSARAFD